MTKKLLDRFENSPRVWTIKNEFNEKKGIYENVIKTYNSIADAHRDNPKISCSHIEDYCNATFFTKQNHWFAYEGYIMAPLVNEIIRGQTYEPNNVNATQYFPYMKYFPTLRKDRITSVFNHLMWDDIITKFIGEATINVIHFPSISPYYTNYEIAKTVANLKYDDARKFMIGLYNDGWNKDYLNKQIIDWCSKNIKRSNLQLPITEYPNQAIKPDKRLLCKPANKYEYM